MRWIVLQHERAYLGEGKPPGVAWELKQQQWKVIGSSLCGSPHQSSTGHKHELRVWCGKMRICERGETLKEQNDQIHRWLRERKMELWGKFQMMQKHFYGGV
jgi:hypothetical protein